MRPIGHRLLAFALTWLTGCSNALYFYETERIAMSLEGRPDSSQPVLGSLGLKQRVAIVAPPKEPDTMGEAMSMISSFRFRKDPGEAGRFDIGPVTIQTAFVTGKAARCLDHIDAVDTAQAQVGNPAMTKDEEDQKRAQEPATQQLPHHRGAGLTLGSLNEYAKIPRAETFTESHCNAVRRRLEHHHEELDMAAFKERMVHSINL